MGTLLSKLGALGITLRALPGGRLHALGPLTEATRATIRERRAAILAELAANDPAHVPGIGNREITGAAELRELVAIVAADWPDDERADALAAALADPEAALTCYRALVHFAHGTRAPAPAREADDGMRTCQQCANLSPGGRCLAAWRGESLGAGIGTSRTYTPAMPDRPQRCGAYAPGPSDPDRRTGRERWPYLFNGVTK